MTLDEAARHIGALEANDEAQSWMFDRPCACLQCRCIREACGDDGLDQTALVLACVMYAQDVAEGRHR